MSEEVFKIKSMSNILIVAVIFFVILIGGMGAGCVDIDNAEMESINISYLVRDVYLGYVNGVSIIVVEYIDGPRIKLIDNKMSTLCDARRMNDIIMKTTQEKESYLLYYERLAEPKAYTYPKGRYILYLSDTQSLNGVDSNNPHPDRRDEETFLS